MTAVDRLGFHLRIKSGDGIYGRRVAFLQEGKTSDDARLVLVEMGRQSSEAKKPANRGSRNCEPD
jgi:hypothetical protein